MPTNRSRARKASSKSKAAAPPTSQPPKEGGSQNQADTLRRLYASLLRCRRVQERLQIATGVAASHYELRLGEEAITVGATAELGAGDTITASPRKVCALLAKAAPVSALLDGDRSAARESWCASVVPDDPFHAGVGIALAHKLAGKRRVVVAFCAERQPSLQVWSEVLGFATAHKLPILFLIEGSNDAQLSGDAAGPNLEPISFQVRDHGIPGIVLDGSDVVAVWRVAQESIHRARNGLGPTLMDCRTDPHQDPLAHMEHYLRKRKLWDDAWKHGLELEIVNAITETAAPQLMR